MINFGTPDSLITHNILKNLYPSKNVLIIFVLATYLTKCKCILLCTWHILFIYKRSV